ncbi:MAG: Fur family transcriptional regulator [Actinomycetota bacterium]
MTEAKSNRHLALPPEARLTPQRRAVLDAIEAFGGRFTALELFERARHAAPRLGLATTYRTLELLRQTGSLHALAVDGRPAYVRCGPEHHHHLVCLSCGSVEDTELCSTPSQRDLTRRHGFRAESHELEIFGTCRRCA